MSIKSSFHLKSVCNKSITHTVKQTYISSSVSYYTASWRFNRFIFFEKIQPILAELIAYEDRKVMEHELVGKRYTRIFSRISKSTKGEDRRKAEINFRHSCYHLENIVANLIQLADMHSSIKANAKLFNQIPFVAQEYNHSRNPIQIDSIVYPWLSPTTYIKMIDAFIELGYIKNVSKGVFNGAYSHKSSFRLTPSGFKLVEGMSVNDIRSENGEEFSEYASGCVINVTAKEAVKDDSEKKGKRRKYNPETDTSYTVKVKATESKLREMYSQRGYDDAKISALIDEFVRIEAEMDLINTSSLNAYLSNQCKFILHAEYGDVTLDPSYMSRQCIIETRNSKPYKRIHSRYNNISKEDRNKLSCVVKFQRDGKWYSSHQRVLKADIVSTHPAIIAALFNFQSYQIGVDYYDLPVTRQIENGRAIAKIAFLVSLNGDSRIEASYAAIALLKKEGFDSRYTTESFINTIFAAIIKKYPEFEPYMFTGIGSMLMTIDGEINRRMLYSLALQGIQVLDVHDGWDFAEMYLHRVEEAFHSSFRDVIFEHGGNPEKIPALKVTHSTFNPGYSLKETTTPSIGNSNKVDVHKGVDDFVKRMRS